MLLKYPEMLWGLLALLLPILVHLLRLRKFRKTAFTNVRVLQRLRLESDRSSRLKKWLLLAARLGLLAALVIAFAQPYRAASGAQRQRDIVVYLDNSMSMEYPSGATTLLQGEIQKLLRDLPGDFRVSILTNTHQYPRQELSGLQDILLTMGHTHIESDLGSLLLRAAPLFSNDPSVDPELWLISDFQGFREGEVDTTRLPRIRAAVVNPPENNNISLDSAYLENQGEDVLELHVDVRLSSPEINQALSLYQGDTLIAKTAPEVDDSGNGSAVFTLPARKGITGTVRVLDEGLPYDNTLYFHLDSPQKIRVLSLGPGTTDYLKRIFTEDEFTFRETRLRTLDFGLLEAQDLLILNGLESIPETLERLLTASLEAGANILIIPPEGLNPDGYNRFLERTAGLSLEPALASENRITNIRSDHPLFRDVFESEISNFEYPQVQSYHRVKGNRPGILEFQDGSPFLLGSGNLYLFTASIAPSNSNLTSSPLIVPTLYALGLKDQLRDALYYTIGAPSSVSLERNQGPDGVYQLETDGYSFIPEQQQLGRKTVLRFGEEPQRSGTYRISGLASEDRFSFNYPRDESRYPAFSGELPKYIQVDRGIDSLLTGYQNETRVTDLWKWFVIFALLFAVAELLLQKFLR